LSEREQSSSVRSRACRSSFAVARFRRHPVAWLSAIASLPIVGACLALAVTGWAPRWDEAILSWHGYDMLAGHPTSLGMPSRAAAGTGQQSFYPGPALFWIIAVPTRLAPRVGPLLGAALLIIGTLVLTLRAVATRWGTPAATAVTAAALVLTVSAADQVLAVPLWNPWMGLLPFAGSLVAAAVVASGGLRSWPTLIILGSIAVQAHLMYAVAAPLIVIAPMLGIPIAHAASSAERPATPVPRRLPPWVPAGFVAAIVLWAPAIWQQLTSSPGGLRLLLDATLRSDQATLGFSSALRYFAAATSARPLPLWARGPRPWTPQADMAGSDKVGCIILAALIALLAVYLLRRRWGPAAVCAITLVAATGTLAVLASIPASLQITASYVCYAFLPVSMLVWTVAGLAVADALASRRRWRPRRPFAWARAITPTLAGIAAVAVAAATAALTMRAPGAADLRGGAASADNAAVGRAALLIGPPPKPGTSLRIEAISPVGWAMSTRLYALAYSLRLRGWRPILDDPSYSFMVDPYYRRGVVAQRVAILPQRPSPTYRALGTIRDSGKTLTVWMAPPLGPNLSERSS